jgi:hypothetical protein
MSGQGKAQVLSLGDSQYAQHPFAPGHGQLTRRDDLFGEGVNASGTGDLPKIEAGVAAEPTGPLQLPMVDAKVIPMAGHGAVYQAGDTFHIGLLQ